MAQSYYQTVGNLVTQHPVQSLIFGLIFAALVILIWSVAIKPVINWITGTERFGTLVTSPASALSNTWGACMSEPGRDGGAYGGCGAAEPFQDMSLRAQIKAARTAQKSGFLNVRGFGLDEAGNAIAADYWQNELNNPGGGNAGAGSDPSMTADAGADAVFAGMAAAQAAQQAVAAVATGAIPASAAGPVASQFAASRLRGVSGFAAEDALARRAMGFD